MKITRVATRCSFLTTRCMAFLTMTAEADAQQARAVQITAKEREALRQHMRALDGLFRKASTDKADMDSLRGALNAWESQAEKIRNRAFRDGRATAPVRQKHVDPATDFDFKFPPIDLDEVERARKAAMRGENRKSRPSESKTRIRLPAGLMNWPMRKPKPRRNARETLQEFDLSRFLAPELDKPLAITK